MFEAILILVFLTVTVAVKALLANRLQGYANIYSRYQRKRTGLLLWATPFISKMVTFNRKRFGRDNPYVAKLRRKIKYAGSFSVLSAEEFLAVQELLVICALVFGPLMLFFAGFDIVTNWYSTLFFMVVLGIIAWFAPIVPIENAIARRQKEIMRNWPFFLDLLTISIEAGMEFTIAVERIVATSSLNALVEELVQFLNEVKLGTRRVEALKAMAARVDIPSVTSIVGMLVQADQLGTPLGPLLRVQAKEFRSQKAQRVEKQALEAPVKMLFPLLVCIFPAILIVLLGPVLIQYFGAQ